MDVLGVANKILSLHGEFWDARNIRYQVPHDVNRLEE